MRFREYSRTRDSPHSLSWPQPVARGHLRVPNPEYLIVRFWSPAREAGARRKPGETGKVGPPAPAGGVRTIHARPDKHNRQTRMTDWNLPAGLLIRHACLPGYFQMGGHSPTTPPALKGHDFSRVANAPRSFTNNAACFERARLQSCRKRPKKGFGLQPLMDALGLCTVRR